MDKIPFCIEEQSLIKFLEDIPKNSQKLSEILGVIESISDFGVCEIHCYNDIYSLEVNGHNVGELLYATAHDGDVRDLITRIETAVARSESCLLSEIDELGHGLFTLKELGAGALICDDPDLGFDWWDGERMFASVKKLELIKGSRRLFISLKLDSEKLDEFAPLLFPGIFFHVPPSQVKTVGVAFSECAALFMSHLSYLSDFARKDFETIKEPHVLIAKAASHGVEMSPESPKTHKHAAAMEERNILVGEKKICCEWHTKLDFTRGRVHFFPWSHTEAVVREAVSDKVIVGIITDHLT
jgi:hypothetical protein